MQNLSTIPSSLSNIVSRKVTAFSHSRYKFEFPADAHASFSATPVSPFDCRANHKSVLRMKIYHGVNRSKPSRYTSVQAAASALFLFVRAEGLSGFRVASSRRALPNEVLYVYARLCARACASTHGDEKWAGRAMR